MRPSYRPTEFFFNPNSSMLTIFGLKRPFLGRIAIECKVARNESEKEKEKEKMKREIDQQRGRNDQYWNWAINLLNRETIFVHFRVEFPILSSSNGLKWRLKSTTTILAALSFLTPSRILRDGWLWTKVDIMNSRKNLPETTFSSPPFPSSSSRPLFPHTPNLSQNFQVLRMAAIGH